jgi:hypothetical protein
MRDDDGNLSSSSSSLSTPWKRMLFEKMTVVYMVATFSPSAVTKISLPCS